MAKRQRNNQISVAFNYLIKLQPDDDEDGEPIEEGFSDAEFARIVRRIRDTTPLDETDDEVIAAIKRGYDVPFSFYEEPERGIHFGSFDGAYYGQRYRNNRLGIVEASDLNLRKFYYIVTRLRDGKILIGTTYHGLYGDYDGLRSTFIHLLDANRKIASRTLKSMADEIGEGSPVSLKLLYRKAADRAERRPLFGRVGAIAITSTEFGDDFGERVIETAQRVHGDRDQRKRALAAIVNQADIISLDEDDIVGCSAVIREDGRTRTVYLLGDNNFSTKFGLGISPDAHGDVNRELVMPAMIRTMRERIMPLLR